MYTDLRSFQQAETIYDFTVEFCGKYIDKFSRTVDQMTQAARSGKQNIAEGCSNGKTDQKSEVKLLNIARGSLKELLEDYEDYLRQHGLEKWTKDDPRAVAMRQLAYRVNGTAAPDKIFRSNTSDKAYRTYQTYLNDPERAANVMITLINQTTYLLDQQIQAVRRQMEERGVSVETHYQKVGRVLNQEKKKQQQFDEWLKATYGPTSQ